MRRRIAVALGATFLMAAGLSAQADVLPIGTWAPDYAYNPSGNAVSGSGNSAGWTFAAGNSAIIAPFTATTLAVGDSIALTGSVSWTATNIGNDQFRIGLMNTNGTSGTSAGWLGYLAEAPNAGAGVLAGRAATGNWASGTGATGLTTSSNAVTGSSTGAPTGTYDFTLTIAQTAAGSQAISASLVSAGDGGATYDWSAAATDSATGSAANATYNEFGFFLGSATSGMTTTAGTPNITFSNVAVTAGASTPEPASAALLGLSSLALIARRRRRIA